MIYGFSAWDKLAPLQSEWFVESLLTQTLIIHIIRTAKIPFFKPGESGADRDLGGLLHGRHRAAIHL
jgi:P-type Mg2+ transporter